MKNNYRLLMVFSLTSMLFLSSCDKEEPVPAYVHVDAFTMAPNPLGFAGNSDNLSQDEGSLSHKITDVWFYVDQKLIGCFELPVTFPVLVEDGIHHVMMRPGIKVNGIAATRSPYPFYTIYEQDVHFEKGKRITLSPTVTYADYSHFVFMEDFEETGIKVDTTTLSEVPLIKTNVPEQVFEGNYSGYMELDDGNTLFELVSSNSYALPKSSAPIFLEFNYKTNHIIAIGTIAVSPFELRDVLVLNPTNGWNKAYLFLTPNVNTSNAVDYYIRMYMNAPGADSVTFQIDNIKIVY